MQKMPLVTLKRTKLAVTYPLAGKILDLLDLEKQVAVVGTASFTIGQLKNLS